MLDLECGRSLPRSITPSNFDIAGVGTGAAAQGATYGSVRGKVVTANGGDAAASTPRGTAFVLNTGSSIVDPENLISRSSSLGLTSGGSGGPGEATSSINVGGGGAAHGLTGAVKTGNQAVSFAGGVASGQNARLESTISDKAGDATVSGSQNLAAGSGKTVFASGALFGGASSGDAKSQSTGEEQSCWWQSLENNNNSSPFAHASNSVFHPLLPAVFNNAITSQGTGTAVVDSVAAGAAGKSTADSAIISDNADIAASGTGGSEGML